MLKMSHVFLAYLTVFGFVLRGVWSLMDSPRREQKWVKIAPHVIDTLLLILGISLVVTHSWSFLDHPWLSAKLVGLLAYIGFGVMCLRASSQRMKSVGFAAALLSVGYIFMVAYSKQVWPL